MSEDIAVGATKVLARFSGSAGEILVLEDPKTGARLYREAGVNQSYVLPGGVAALNYIRLMSALLNRDKIVLFGCGGGALAGELHRAGRAVTVVDTNARSFEIARQYFWMPHYIACVTDDMRSYLMRKVDRVSAIGVDVGGPGFDYGPVLDRDVCALLSQRLLEGGVIAVNIACDWAEPGTIPTILEHLGESGLEVLHCEEMVEESGNAVLVGAKGRIDAALIDFHATELGFRVKRAYA